MKLLMDLQDFQYCQGIAPRQRGAWIETADLVGCTSHGHRIAPRQRGAWIETMCRQSDQLEYLASPLGNEGRGLKQSVVSVKYLDDSGIAPRQRGAWIETHRLPLQGKLARGIAPRQRGAWIETTSLASMLGGAPASPLGNEGRGLKHVLAAVIRRYIWHRPSATRGVD